MSFLWGAATSSYQTEGGITNNDWHYFTTSPQIKRRILKMTTPSLFYSKTRQALLQPANEAASFWEPRIYETDFKNASQIGLNSLRISLEWSRLEPHRNEWKNDVLEAYKKVDNTHERKPIDTHSNTKSLYFTFMGIDSTNKFQEETDSTFFTPTTERFSLK